jgi:hypothetical protein
MTVLPSPFTSPPLPPILQKASKELIVVKIYQGSQESATVAFQADAAKMAKQEALS